MKKSEAYWPLILLLALIKFVLPLFLQSSIYELQRDEYLYYEQGQHLALGYLENPPLLSWLGYISSWFGGSEAWIKFWPCLFGAATLVVTCLITAEFGGGRFAQFLAGLGIITGAFLRVHFLFQPNILDIFSWTLAIYFLVRYINTGNPAFVYWIVISVVIGWWGKYSILFLAAGMLAGILMTKHRILFTKKQSWLALLLGLILVAPNIFWQFQHKWPLVHHMQELQETQLQFLDPADFFKEQLLLLFPVVFVWIIGLVWLLRRRNYRIVAFVYFIIIILLIAGRGKSYYALGIYPALLAAGATAIESATRQGAWKRYAITILVLVLSLPLVPVLLPVYPPEKLSRFYKQIGIDKLGLLRWEDQRDHALPQDFADMLGWKELTAKAEGFYNTLDDSTQSNTIIYGRHYGHAGALLYYGKNRQFRENVFTDNGSFLQWIPDNKPFTNLLFIGRNKPGSDDEVFNHFESSRLVDTVDNIYSRQFGDRIIFYEKLDSSGWKLAVNGLKEMKKEFQRD